MPVDTPVMMTMTFTTTDVPSLVSVLRSRKICSRVRVSDHSYVLPLILAFNNRVHVSWLENIQGIH